MGKNVVAVILLLSGLMPCASAQLASPNESGVAMGHLHDYVRDVGPALFFAQGSPSRPVFEEVRRFAAAEATQGVAVDADHFYAITNRRIGKYDKRSGERVGVWEGEPDGPIIHLDSGIVLDGRLYCAHSNYPGVPMVSSIEMFDTETMDHVGSHSFGIFGGSATWADWAEGYWWVAFGHYAGRGGVPGQGPAWTNLVQFDENWRRVAGYVYPSEVVERFETMSNSGGTWGKDGQLYATGHDTGEVFVLSLPTAGSVLELRGILPVTAEGQGIAWDRSEPGTLYSIIRSSREVVVSKLRDQPPPPRRGGDARGARHSRAAGEPFTGGDEWHVSP